MVSQGPKHELHTFITSKSLKQSVNFTFYESKCFVQAVKWNEVRFLIIHDVSI